VGEIVGAFKNGVAKMLKKSKSHGIWFKIIYARILYIIL
jgi:hypothetical protein